MKTIVITGGTRGIGYGLANAFLARDCGVVICGRTQQAVEQAVGQLAQRHSRERILGQPCDVTDHMQVQALWDAALSRFGQIDIWVNNAGISGEQKKIWEQTSEQAKMVLDTNIAGVFYGTQVAMQGMLAQGFGALYNTGGMGSDGRIRIGLGIYGTTKCALQYLTDALVKELEGTPIIVGVLRPGMVLTDLVLDHYRQFPQELKKVKRIFNIIADTVENVTPWLADQILANQKTGVSIEYTSRLKLWGRFLKAPFSKRDLFADLNLE